MIEAVNSVIASSSLLRGNTEQVSTARAFAANPNRVQETASSGSQPLISPFPFIFVDVNFDTAVLQFRDSSGAVVEQIPSQSRLEAQQRSQAEVTAPVQQQQPAQVEAAAVQQTVSAEAQAAVQAFSAAAQTTAQTTGGDVSVFA